MLFRNVLRVCAQAICLLQFPYPTLIKKIRYMAGADEIIGTYPFNYSRVTMVTKIKYSGCYGNQK